MCSPVKKQFTTCVAAKMVDRTYIDRQFEFYNSKRLLKKTAPEEI